MTRNSRGGNTFERPVFAKQARPSILIVCEGEVTELEYFRNLCNEYKLSNTDVEIFQAKGTDAGNIVAHAIDLRDKRKKEAKRNTLVAPYDQVWCVFDTEVLEKNPKIHQAVNKAANKELKLAISNPAFEYWFLLHFEHTDRPFHDGPETIIHLKKHIPNYTKTKADFPKIFEKVFPKTDEAIPKAHTLLEAHIDYDSKKPFSFPNSSTKVYLLVQTLQKSRDFKPWENK